MSTDIEKILKTSGLDFTEVESQNLKKLSNIISAQRKDQLIPNGLPNLNKLCKILKSFEEHSDLIQYPLGLNKLINISSEYPGVINNYSSSKNPGVTTHPSFNLIVETSKSSTLFQQFLARLFVWDWCIGLIFQPSSKTKLVKSLMVEHSIKDLSNEISQFIGELNLDLNEDLFAIAFKVRLKFKSKSEKKDEQYLFDTLSKFIDHLFTKNSEFNSNDNRDQNTNDLSDIELDSIELEDSTLTVDLYEIQRRAINRAKTLYEEDLELVEDAPHVRFEKIPKDVKNKSSRYQKGYAKTAILRTTQQAQFLDNANERLTDSEGNQLIQGMLKEDSETTTQLLITLCFGAEPNCWSSWKTQKSDHDCWIDLKKGVWSSPTEFEKKPKPLKASVLHIFKNTENVFVKPIPNELLTRLRALSASKFETLGQVFKKTSEAISIDCDKWINTHNSLGRNLSLAKVRNHLYHTIMLQSFDEAAAWYITGQHVHKFHRSTTYTTFATSDLIKTYKNALPAFTFEDSQLENKFIGSNRSIALTELSTLQKQLYKNVIETKASIISNSSCLGIESIADFHNKLVTYLALLILIYGHRPTDDPMARIDDLVNSMNALFICDKIIDDNHKTRIGFLPDIVTQQIIEYKNHLEWLQNTLSVNQQTTLSDSIKAALDSSEENTPFLFFLDIQEQSCSITSVTSTILKSRLQEVNSLWKDIPMNFGRHFLATRLRELGLNPEYIHYQLGHISTGEEPYGSLSFLSPRIVSKILVPKLNEICEELEIKLITNLSDLTNVDLFPSIKIKDVQSASKLIGPLNRINEYKKRSQAESSVVRSVYNKYLEGIISSDISTEMYSVLAKKAIVETVEKSLYQPHKNLLKLSRLMNAQAKKIGIEFSAPTRILKIGLEPTPFDYENTFLWSKAEDIRAKFQTQLITTDIKNLSYTQTCVMVFLSLMLHSRFSDTKRFEQIFEAITQKEITFDKGQGYFEVVVRQTQIQRIPFDSITANLLLLLLEKESKEVSFKTVFTQLNTVVEKEFGLSWKAFISTLTIDTHLNMPACIANVATGKNRIASVPKDSFARITSKRPLKPQPKAVTIDSTEKSELWTSIILSIGNVEKTTILKGK